MQTYEGKSLISHIRDYVAAGAILVGSALSAFGQDNTSKPIEQEKPKLEQKVNDKKDAPLMRLDGPAVYMPAKYLSTHVSGQFTEGLKENEESGYRIDAGFKHDDIDVRLQAGGFKSTNLFVQDIESFDPTALIFDVENKTTRSGFLFGADAKNVFAWYNNQKQKRDSKIHNYSILVDDGTTLQDQDIRQNETDDTTLSAGRFGYRISDTVLPYFGFFRSTGDHKFDRTQVDTISGPINFSTTATERLTDEFDLNGFLGGIEALLGSNYVVGLEGMSGSGTLKSTSFMDDGTNPPTSSSSETALDFWRILAHGRAKFGPAYLMAEAGYQDRKEGDGEFMGGLSAILRAGDHFMFSASGGQDPNGNTFFRGGFGWSPHGYTDDDLMALGNLDRVWRNVVAYLDPTHSDPQRALMRTEGMWALASQVDSGLLITYGRVEEQDFFGGKQDVNQVDLAIMAGHGIVFNSGAEIRGSNDPLFLHAGIHVYMQKLLGLPIHVRGEYYVTQIDGVSTDPDGYQVLVGADLGDVIDKLFGKKETPKK